MDSLNDAKERIAHAEQASVTALTAWRGAVSALGENVTVNGFGVIRDRTELTQRLHAAQAQIDACHAALTSVAWPTNADYDQA